MTSKQQQVKKIMDAIRQVLVEDWDPLGIRGAGPEDEYDSCIGPLYHLLMQKPNEAEVIDLLLSLNVLPVAISPDELKSIQNAAKKLLAIDVSMAD